MYCLAGRGEKYGVHCGTAIPNGIQYLGNEYAAMVILQAYANANKSGNLKGVPKEILTPDQAAKLWYLANMLVKANVPNFNPSFPPPPPVNQDSSKLALPVYNVMESIFGNLLGTSSDNCKVNNDGQMKCDNEGSTKQNKDEHTAADVENVMEQIYNLGLTTNPMDVDNIPGHPTTNKNPSGGSAAGDLVNQHFSSMQQAQLVGYNLIGTAIGAMNNIFTNYSDKVHKAIQQGEGNAVKIKNACMMAAVFTWMKGDCEKMNVDATQVIAAELAGLGLTLMWLPLAIVVLSSLLVAGVQFAFFVPFMPYFLFWAGKVTWLLLVLEALVAAPIMALGIVWPDGHDLWGAAEPGVKMVVQVLLFPALLVIGLLVGMCLSYIVIHFSAQGFHAVGSSVLDFVPISTYTGTADISLVQGVIACFMIMLYGTFIVMAFQQCFSAIYVLPDRVLSWIGVQGIKFGEQQLNEMKSASQQNAQKGADAAGQSLTQGTQALQNQGKTIAEGNIQTGQAGAKPMESSVQAAKEGIQMGASIGRMMAKGGAGE